MRIRSALATGMLSCATACLAAGLAMAWGWIGAFVAVTSGFAWLCAVATKPRWLPTACLTTSVLLAVLGTLARAPPLTMLLGSTASLATWDLVTWAKLDEQEVARASGLGPLGGHHLRALAQGLVPGAVLAVLGRQVAIAVPFLVMVGLVVVATMSLGHFMRRGA